jgi:hypothetical protein
MKSNKINKLDSAKLKQIQRAEEAERSIKQMEANKGKMNIHRISEKEIDDVGSIDSSNVDYLEIFEERIDKLEGEIYNTNRRVSVVVDLITKTETTLKELNKKSLSEIQEYVYTLHKEVDELAEKLTNIPAMTLNEENLKKLVK